jgi:hypothetical protein
MGAARNGSILIVEMRREIAEELVRAGGVSSK